MTWLWQQRSWTSPSSSCPAAAEAWPDFVSSGNNIKNNLGTHSIAARVCVLKAHVPFTRLCMCAYVRPGQRGGVIHCHIVQTTTTADSRVVSGAHPHEVESVSAKATIVAIVKDESKCTSTYKLALLPKKHSPLHPSPFGNTRPLYVYTCCFVALCV